MFPTLASAGRIGHGYLYEIGGFLTGWPNLSCSCDEIVNINTPRKAKQAANSNPAEHELNI
jgi:hypothetical protein